MTRKSTPPPDTRVDPILPQIEAYKYLGYRSARTLRKQKHIPRTRIPGTTHFGYRLSDLNAEIARAQDPQARTDVRRAS